ncbi:MAG: glycosyltransferase family 2 protein [Acetobacteraceae bacterium]|nr:glycosyltransferase family 2 protein [Acetobacteraceae bacterium]
MTVSRPRVAILLSTFNGARFLPAQLDSLLRQTERGWLLLWRDDGSSDETVAIVEAFAREVGGERCRRVEREGRLGVAGSFYALLAAAQPLGLPVAFADQDDVWLPEKLSRALAALAPVERPALYCSRQVLVDDALEPIGGSPPFRRPPSFAGALTQNIATGCTVVLNAAAATLVDRSTKPQGPLHDWWSYLLVAGAGGTVIADPEPTILYRQHAANLVGAPSTRRRRAIAALRRGPGAYLAMLRANVAALRAASGVLTPAASQIVVQMDRALRAGPWARFRALWIPGLRRQTFLEAALFRIWFLRG